MLHLTNPFHQFVAILAAGIVSMLINVHVIRHQPESLSDVIISTALFGAGMVACLALFWWMGLIRPN